MYNHDNSMINFNFRFIINFIIGIVFLTPIVLIFSKGLFSIFEINEKIYLTRYLFGSLSIILLVSVIVLFISVPLAWITTMTEFKGRKILQILCTLPLAVPAYISAYSYAEIFEPAGFLSIVLNNLGINFIGFSIRNIYFASLILSLSLFPYVYLLTRISIINLSARYIEAGRTIGKSPWDCFFKIGVPMSMPGIIAGLALALMETINDFGVASFFAINTLSIGVYNYISILNNLDAAFVLSLTIIILMFVLYYFEQKIRGKKSYSNSNYEFLNWTRYKLSNKKAAAALYVGILPVLFGYFIPTIYMIYTYIINIYRIDYGNFFESLINTLFLGGIVALVCSLISIIINYSQRFSKNIFSIYMKKLINLGYAIPGVVIALGVIFFIMGLDQILDYLIINKIIISSTLIGLILALSIRLISLSNNSIDSGLDKISKSIDDASRMIGRRYSTTYFRIIIPQINLSIFAGIFLVMVDTMKELPITLLLRPFGFDTLATELYVYSSNEDVELGSLNAIAIIAFLTFAIFLLDKVIDKKLILKSKK